LQGHKALCPYWGGRNPLVWGACDFPRSQTAKSDGLRQPEIPDEQIAQKLA